MEREPQLELERRIHALLCGDLNADEKREVLLQVARDEGARQLLGEMLALEQSARTAYGYETAQGALDASLASVLSSLERQQPAAQGRRRRVLMWLARAAAVLVIAAVTAAVTTYWADRAMQQRVAGLREGVGMAQVSPAEIRSYRKVWQEVVDGRAGGVPWLLMSEGTGEFGYLPGASESAAGGRLVLMRCRLVGSGGDVLETLNIILPADRATRLSLPDAGRLDGLPIHYEASAAGGWAAVALTVGETAVESVGVRGRVAIGGVPVEMGQFHLDGRRVHVWLQVVPFAETLG